MCPKVGCLFPMVVVYTAPCGILATIGRAQPSLLFSRTFLSSYSPRNIDDLLTDFIQRDSGRTDHGTFQCNSDGEEFPEIWKCDGILDCYNSEDEYDCDTDPNDYIRLISKDAGNINTDCNSNGFEIQLQNDQSYLFSHPNFPDQYGPNTDCGWLFNAPLGYNVKIDLINFLLPDKRGCMADSFEIYDGRTIQNERIGSFCQLPEYIPLSLRNVF